MNQCVPSWDLDDPALVAAGGGGFSNHPLTAAGSAHHRGGAAAPAGVTAAGGAFAPAVVPMADQYYEVAELTWEKGNISSHGLLNRSPPSKYHHPPAAPPPPPHLQGIGGDGGAGGAARDRETLEAVVGEAAARSHFLSPPAVRLAPWVGVGAGAGAAAAVARADADALGPCAARADDTDTENIEHQHRRGASDSRCFSCWPQAKLSRDTWYTAARRGCSACERWKSGGVGQHGAWLFGAAGREQSTV